MMLPAQLFLVPVYLILSKLHLLDTPWALIIPATSGGFGVFLMAQFMRAIPRSLEEAAMIDGCSKLGVYLHVALPLCGPALATLGIFTFIGSWNDFVGPLISSTQSATTRCPSVSRSIKAHTSPSTA